jgi:hypothetical protein
VTRMRSRLKFGVLHVNTAMRVSDAPTMRIARYVAERLGCPLIHDVASATAYASTDFDVLFVKYGILKFSQHRDRALDIYSRAGRIIDLQNDYTMQPDSRFKKANPSYEVWGTVPDRADVYINWNMLTWYHAYAPARWRDREEAVLYYGAYRPGRDAALRKFYGPAAPYPVHISANPRNRPKFAAMNPNASLLSKMTTHEIAQYRMTVYVEDETSHTLYCSMANRFYECLSLGVPMVFDSACVPTLQRAGLLADVTGYGWLVHSAKDVGRLLPDAELIGAHQRQLWHRNYYAALGRQLRTAINTHL